MQSFRVACTNSSPLTLSGKATCFASRTESPLPKGERRSGGAAASSNPLPIGSRGRLSSRWTFVDGGGYATDLACVLKDRRSRWCILILRRGYLFVFEVALQPLTGLRHAESEADQERD